MPKVLIVDDEIAIFELLASLLTLNGFQVLTTCEGKEALRLANSEQPDLILLDINMPGMDGGDIARELANHSRTKGIPILFLSAMVTEGEETRIHGHEFISKLDTEEEILNKIKKTLGIES